ncbi:NfeD family protein|uniref:NfeD family protein n=1 Tax=Noviherbaspirillum sp. L7-7A TaxID=2850560 RepID=UPI001C2CA321|nr:NfeD family protein [Noviherbaspirillum sp. L7-7A]MBV0878567.1 NfeD family protein [Noviherbaspirillum sp. L7-7A]
MTAWMVWLALAGLLVILEMFSGTFYLLMIALGMVAGALAAWLGLSAEVQILLAALIGAAAALALRRRRPRRTDAARDPNINLDIGQSLHVSHWHEGSARAMYRGALWDVELAHGAHARTGQFVIREVRGSRLIVSNQPE